MDDERLTVGSKDVGRRGSEGWDRIVAVFSLTSRYFRIVGVRGAVKLPGTRQQRGTDKKFDAYLSTLPGNRTLYASKIFLLTFLTSAFASLAVARIMASMSRARASFSRSGGLKQFIHVSMPSAAVSLKDVDLSLIDCEK